MKKYTKFINPFISVLMLVVLISGLYPQKVFAAGTASTEAATSVTETTATLNGTIVDVGGVNAVSRGFEYGVNTSYGLQVDENGSFGIGAYSVGVTSLTCGTIYHYRSFFKNPVDVVAGNDQTFTTSACAGIISTPAISGITVPVTGSTPTATIAETTEYTATISWNGNPVTFAPSTIYTATITLTPNAGYTLTGVSADFFTVAGATTVTNSIDSGIITVVFPMTAASVSNLWVNVGNAGFSAGGVNYTSLAMAPDGTPYVAYRDESHSFKATVMKYDGTNWVNVGNTGFSSGGVTYTSLIIDSNGTPYVAYSDFGNGAKATVMKYDGNSWVNVGTPGFSEGQVSYSSLSVYSDGTPYVAYQDYANGSKATVMKYDGNSWVNVGTPGFSAGFAGYTSLSLSLNGTPYLAYQDGGNSSKATVVKYDGTSWVNVGTPGLSTGFAGYTSLSLSLNGTPYLAYQDTANSNKATVMKYNGTSWVAVGGVGFSAGITYSTSLALLLDGTPYVAYTDDTNSSKATVMKYDGNSWVNVGTPGFSTGSVSFTSLALSSDGIPYLLYKDYANSNKATLMKFPILNPILTTSSATYLSKTTATLNGNISNTGGDNPTVRGFNYGLTTSYGTDVIENGSFGNGVYTSNSNSLSCATTYHFRSYATNSAGTGYGDDVSFVTSPCITSGGGGGGSSGGGSGGGVIINPTIPMGVICNIGQVFSPTTGKLCTSFTEIPTTSSNTLTLTRTLKLKTPRMNGDDVKQLQVYLVSKGYDIGTPDGVYGTKSSIAIAKFQTENNLKADGVLGPVTRALLFNTPSIPITPTTPSNTPTLTRTLKLKTPRMSGNDVKDLQIYLTSKGYDLGTPDGIYGTKSSMAIAKFQTENNLKADGALGPVTRELLFR